MSGKGVCCRSCTVLVKVPVSLPTVATVAVLLGSLFHSKPTLADTCPAPSFAARRAFHVEYGSQSVAVADFNGDGKPDLAVANTGFLSDPVLGSGPPTSGTVSVLLGKGEGTFQSAVSFGVGAVPLSVAAGDFNGDGKADLAVANERTDNVSVLLGKGDGTFQAAVNYGAGAYPCSVAVGDFNGDGKPDLADANFGSTNELVILGNGDGTFQDAVSYANGGLGPHSVAVGDFNGDGKADMVVANAGSGNVAVVSGQS